MYTLSLRVIRFKAAIFGRLVSDPLSVPRYAFSYRRIFVGGKSLSLANPLSTRWELIRFNWMVLPCMCWECQMSFKDFGVVSEHRGRRNVITFFVKPAGYAEA